MKSTSNLFNRVLLGVIVLLVLGGWQYSAPSLPPLLYSDVEYSRPGGPGVRAVRAASQSAPVAADGCDTTRSVQVSGAAVVYVIPDRALIQLGVQSNGTSPEAVQSANFQQIQAVTRAVRALGVDAKDIATDYYIVYPVYEDYNSLAIKGYRIDNTVSITLRDVSLAERAIVAALKAGANQVQDVQFYTSELRKHRDQARALAMKAAGEKAQALAEAAGAQTGCVLSINENSWAQYFGSWRGGRETALWAQNTVQNAAPAQGASGQMDDSPISLGQIAVRAEVNASYSLR